MQFQDIKNGRFYLGDCLEVMKEIPDGVIDMLLVDLPYGTTACSWDSIIPFDKLWEQYNRICKESAAMVFTASQPFTTALIASNIDNFKYCWVWNKAKAGNIFLAKMQPMKIHEDVVVFSKSNCKSMIYNPQFIKRDKIKRSKNYGTGEAMGGNRKPEEKIYEYDKKNPVSIIDVSNASQKGKIHPTQKPVELFEYLIKTYTNEGDLVLDNTAGSGTTAIAAENTGRKWVCIEQNEEYATKAVERILNREVKPQESTSGVQIDSGIPIPEGDEQCK